MKKFVRAMWNSLPDSLKTTVRPLFKPLWLLLEQERFLLEFGFSPPPRGTDLTGYETLIRFIEANDLLSVPGDIIEIGAFLGGGTYKLSKFLERQASCKRIYVVDIFEPAADQTECTNGISMSTMYEQVLQRTGEGLSQLEIFREVTKDCRNIVVIKGDSKSIDLSVDTVSFGFIDGNHSPTYVRNDFYLIWRKLSPKGVVAFDDYGHDLPQVTRTVDALVKEHDDKIAYICKKEKIFFIQRR